MLHIPSHPCIRRRWVSAFQRLYLDFETLRISVLYRLTCHLSFSALCTLRSFVRSFQLTPTSASYTVLSPEPGTLPPWTESSFPHIQDDNYPHGYVDIKAVWPTLLWPTLLWLILEGIIHGLKYPAGKISSWPWRCIRYQSRRLASWWPGLTQTELIKSIRSKKINVMDSDLLVIMIVWFGAG